MPASLLPTIVRASAAAAVLVLLLSGLATAQGRKDKDLPPNTPSLCPYCGGEPDRMERAGIVSHGGFEFANSDTAGMDAFFPALDVHWIETAHFEIGLAIEPYKVPVPEKKDFFNELTELQEVLPEVNPKEKIIDPWLRTHMYAARVEKLYDRFLELMSVEQSDFPSGPITWDLKGKFMGIGPHLGQKGKFEILILPAEAYLVDFLRENFGLSTKLTQRWNVIERDTLNTTIQIRQGGLRKDKALHGHLAFCLAHNMLNAYKHYSYDTPIWILEGLAHFMEREITKEHNTFDGAEGTSPLDYNKEDWLPEVKKIISAGEAPRMAELVNLNNYGELELRHHLSIWSMIDYLVKVHPEGFACLNDKLHGRVNAEGYPDGSNLRDVHRDAFQECLGMSYADFDAAWSRWVLTGETGETEE